MGIIYLNPLTGFELSAKVETTEAAQAEESEEAQEMKLLFLHEWVGQSHAFSGEKIAPTERLMSMATFLSLSEALSRIRMYCASYAKGNASVGLVVEFRLLSVSDIEPLHDGELSAMNVELIENLGRS